MLSAAGWSVWRSRSSASQVELGFFFSHSDMSDPAIEVPDVPGGTEIFVFPSQRSTSTGLPAAASGDNALADGAAAAVLRDPFAVARAGLDDVFPPQAATIAAVATTAAKVVQFIGLVPPFASIAPQERDRRSVLRPARRHERSGHRN